jgi:competence protein ComEC
VIEVLPGIKFCFLTLAYKFGSGSELAKRPLACGFFLLAGGIIYARYTEAYFNALLFLTALLAVSAIIFRKKSKNVFLILLCSLVFITGALSYINFNTLPANDIYRFLDKPQQHAYIKGTVKTLPAYTWQRWGNRRCSFLLNVESYKKDNTWVKASGLSQLTINANEKEYGYGDRILIYGDAKKLVHEKSASPGYIRYLSRRGIYTAIKVKKDEDIAPVGKAHPLSFKKYIHNLRRRTERRFKKYLPYPDDAILSAMLVGRRESIPKSLTGLFINTGTIHILSVSGLHAGIISAIIFFFLKLFYIPQRPLSAITILFLWLYVVMAGSRTPVVRASIMISVYLLSVILERDFDIYSALSFAGIFILLLNPMQVFDAGFQLSFSCVFFIVFLTPRIEGIFFKDELHSKKPMQKGRVAGFLFYLRKAFFPSLAVFVGVWPIVAFHFGIISPVTVIANMVVIPFLGVVLFFGAVLACVPDMLHFLASFISGVLHYLFLGIFNAVGMFSKLPFAYFSVKAFSLWLVFLYYAALYIVCQGFSPYNMHAKAGKDF